MKGDFIMKKNIREFFEYLIVYAFAGVCAAAILSIALLAIYVVFKFNPVLGILAIVAGFSAAVTGLILRTLKKVKKERKIKENAIRNKRKLISILQTLD